ncbi:GDSL esterase/lipase At5g45670 [Linum grandiflorum]
MSLRIVSSTPQMALNRNSYLRVPAVMLLLLISLSHSGRGGVRGEPQVPCYFIFGDSLYDSGNNNRLAATPKSNYLPYGIDFPTGPSGRFSNGYNAADASAKLLGFRHLIPPFATATWKQLRRGVNYASGGAGIRDETSYTQGERIPLNWQLRNHQIVISRISMILRSKKLASKLLAKCIYTVGIGSNDYINNYYLPDLYNTSNAYPNPDHYAAALAHQLFHQLKVLYKQGARKVALFGLAPIGCAPFVVAAFGNSTDTKNETECRSSQNLCVDSINNVVQQFNARLPLIVDVFNAKFPGARFTFIDTYAILDRNLTAQGFEVLNCSCCELGDGQPVCVESGKVCRKRREYQYWDGMHPTEELAFYAAKMSYNMSPSTAHPFDLQTLALLSN